MILIESAAEGNRLRLDRTGHVVGKLELIGEIDDHTAEDIRHQLGEIGCAQHVELSVDSKGGDLRAMFDTIDAIERHGSEVVAIIRGLCASAATDLCVAVAHQIIVCSGAAVMVHNSGIRATDEYLADKLAERSGNRLSTVNDWLRREVYFSAAQAVQYGIADDWTPYGARRVINLNGRPRP